MQHHRAHRRHGDAVLSTHRLATNGGKPEFERRLSVGQFNFPDWNRYETAMKDVFERQWYTNHGPVAQRFEQRLQDWLGVRHAICVANSTIGMMMAAEAMELSGKVIVPGLSHIAAPLSLRWCGLEPVFCDVDLHTHHLTIAQLEKAMRPGVSAVFGVHLGGNAADCVAIDDWATAQGIQSYWDSAQALGCAVGGRLLGCFGALEVFSLHATEIVSAGEGGFITTNDDALAARLRNIRSSYGAGPPVPVVRTSNGRFSELQAAIAMLSLDDFETNRARNEVLWKIYEDGLYGVDGIRLCHIQGVTASNFQMVVLNVDSQRFGVSRDVLHAALKAENVLTRRHYCRGGHELERFSQSTHNRLPATDVLQKQLLLLPIGARVDPEAVTKICALIRLVQEHGAALDRQLC